MSIERTNEVDQKEVEKKVKNAKSAVLTQLILACKSGRTTFVGKMLKLVDPSGDGNLAIQVACGGGQPEVVRLLLSDDRVDPTGNDNFAICSASLNGHFEVVQILLAHKDVDPSARNNYPIRAANQNNHLEVIKLLLNDKRVDPSDGEDEALGYACSGGFLDAAILLKTDPRVNPSSRANFAIRLASRRGHVDLVQYLLQDERVDPSDADNKALIKASKNGHLEVARILLRDERVDPTANDHEAIRLAVEKGHPEVAKLLLADSRTNLDELKVSPKFSVELENVIQEAKMEKLVQNSEDDILEEELLEEVDFTIVETSTVDKKDEKTSNGEFIERPLKVEPTSSRIMEKIICEDSDPRNWISFCYTTPRELIVTGSGSGGIDQARSLLLEDVISFCVLRGTHIIRGKDRSLYVDSVVVLVLWIPESVGPLRCAQAVFDVEELSIFLRLKRFCVIEVSKKSDVSSSFIVEKLKGVRGKSIRGRYILDQKPDFRELERILQPKGGFKGTSSSDTKSNKLFLKNELESVSLSMKLEDKFSNLLEKTQLTNFLETRKDIEDSELILFRSVIIVNRKKLSILAHMENSIGGKQGEFFVFSKSILVTEHTTSTSSKKGGVSLIRKSLNRLSIRRGSIKPMRVIFELELTNVNVRCYRHHSIPDILELVDIRGNNMSFKFSSVKECDYIVNLVQMILLELRGHRVVNRFLRPQVLFKSLLKTRGESLGKGNNHVTDSLVYVEAKTDITLHIFNHDKGKKGKVQTAQYSLIGGGFGLTKSGFFVSLPFGSVEERNSTIFSFSSDDHQIGHSVVVLWVRVLGMMGLNKCEDRYFYEKDEEVLEEEALSEEELSEEEVEDNFSEWESWSEQPVEEGKSPKEEEYEEDKNEEEEEEGEEEETVLVIFDDDDEFFGIISDLAEEVNNIEDEIDGFAMFLSDPEGDEEPISVAELTEEKEKELSLVEIDQHQNSETEELGGPKNVKSLGVIEIQTVEIITQKRVKKKLESEKKSKMLSLFISKVAKQIASKVKNVFEEAWKRRGFWKKNGRKAPYLVWNELDSEGDLLGLIGFPLEVVVGEESNKEPIHSDVDEEGGTMEEEGEENEDDIQGKEGQSTEKIKSKEEVEMEGALQNIKLFVSFKNDEWMIRNGNPREWSHKKKGEVVSNTKLDLPKERITNVEGNDENVRKIVLLKNERIQELSKELKETKGELGLTKRALERSTKKTRLGEFLFAAEEEVENRTDPSKAFHELGRVGSNERIDDKVFYSRGRHHSFYQRFLFISKGVPCMYFETILYNREKDERINLFLEDSEQKFSKRYRELRSQENLFKFKKEYSFSKNRQHQQEVVEGRLKMVDQFRTLVSLMMKSVSDFYGGMGNMENLDKNLNEKIRSIQKETSKNVVMLGELEGCGACRHRSLLFKILCDVIGMKCYLFRGDIMGPSQKYHAHVWNVVFFDGRGYTVDCINFVEPFDEDVQVDVGFGKVLVFDIYREWGPEENNIKIMEEVRRRRSKKSSNQLFMSHFEGCETLTEEEFSSTLGLDPISKEKNNGIYGSWRMKKHSQFMVEESNVELEKRNLVVKFSESHQEENEEKLSKTIFHSTFVECLCSFNLGSESTTKVSSRSRLKVFEEMGCGGLEFLKQMKRLEMFPVVRASEILILFLNAARALLHLHDSGYVMVSFNITNLSIRWNKDLFEVEDVKIKDLEMTKLIGVGFFRKTDFVKLLSSEEDKSGLSLDHLAPEIRSHLKKKVKTLENVLIRSTKGKKKYFFKFEESLDCFSFGKFMEPFLPFLESFDEIVKFQNALVDKKPKIRPRMIDCVSMISSCLRQVNKYIKIDSRSSFDWDKE